MAVMTTSGTIPRGPFTVADVDSFPDDGNRYEIVDGLLVVSPSPVPRHQIVVGHLFLALSPLARDGVRVFTAPLDVELAADTVVEPDVLVVRPEHLTEKRVVGPPLLAVEVLSPSTRQHDLLLKRERYQRAGVPHYWVVDPDAPRLLAWQLRDGEYVPMADVSGAEAWTAPVPFGVTLVPDDLVR